MLRVRDIMTESPMIVGPDDPLDVAENLLLLGEMRHLPVIRGGKLSGILSLRDLARAALPGTASESAQVAHLRALHVANIMNRAPRTASPEDSIAQAACAMLSVGISSLPVLDGEALVGIVTTTDLIAFAIKELRRHEEELGNTLAVSSLMTSHPTVVRPDDRINLAELLMHFGHFHHLPVVSEGALVGIISDRDILGALQSSERPVSVAERLLEKVRVRVSDIMTSAPHTASIRTDATEAAQQLLDHRIGALPVTDGTRLAGILTERDFLRYLCDRLAPRRELAMS